MPLYFFNVYNDDVTMDEEGAELADLPAALAHATTAARSLAAETTSKGHLTLHHRVEITDDGHRTLGAVKFGEAVEVRP